MRAPPHYRLTERYRTILHYTGFSLLMAAVLMLAPLLALPAYPTETRSAIAFLEGALAIGLLGIALWRGLKPRTEVTLSVGEAGIIVLFSWTAVCLLSAWPLGRAAGLDATRAIFESVSGWTTTGLSVVDVERADRIVLLWRSLMQLAGGAGFAILVLTAMSTYGGAGLSLAEGRGDQLVPQVRRSARLVLTIYGCYAVGGMVAYVLAGMGWFDAVNHTFGAISTGGFSTRAASIGHWNSTAVEAVTLPLMILGNLNFLTAWLLFRGRVGSVWRDSEVRFFLLLIAVSAPLLLSAVVAPLYAGLVKPVRVALFETVTALTTTGYSTVAYGNWSPLGWTILIGLMIVGGGIGSTAGGMKQLRIHLLLRNVGWEIKRLGLPGPAVFEPWVWRAGHRTFIGPREVQRLAAFGALYMATWMMGTCVLVAYGVSIPSAAFEFASAVGTVGLSVGVTSAGAPDGILWAESLAMFLGRLEFFVVIASTARLWRALRS